MSHDRLPDRYPVIEHAEGRHRRRSGLEGFVALIVFAALAALIIFVVFPASARLDDWRRNPNSGRHPVVTAPPRVAPSTERFVMPKEGCPPGTPSGALVTVNPDGSVDCDPPTG